jgi:Domain of unknown function (DUF4382)
MANNMLVTGLKRALVVGGALIVGACDLDGLFGNDGGRVQISLAPENAGGLASIIPDTTGAARDDDDDDGNKGRRGSFWFKTANVTLSSILVRTEDGELIELDAELPIVVDVVQIDGGKQVQLPDGFLPPGSYDEVVFVITAVQGVSHDGTVITIEPPGGGWTTVVPICSLEVLEGETVPVGIAFNVRNSFLQVGNWWSFRPQFRSMNNHCVDADDDDEDDNNDG